jgi:hypothetical protein
VIDARSLEVVPAGRPGTLVLGPRRYLTGFSVRLLPGACACGGPGPALEALA